MSDFLETETFRVLEEGFVGPPKALERGQTAVFAVTVREPYAAVFFIRRSRNDNWDTDCTVAYHSSVGVWSIAGFGGSGWWDPFERPLAGWDGDPVVWGGKFGSDLGDEGSEMFVQALKGMASPSVNKLEVFDSSGGLFDVVDIREDTGVFVVVVVGDGPHTVVARDDDGHVVRDGLGREVRDVFDPDDHEADLDLLGGDEPEQHGIVLGAIGKDDEGRWFVDSSDTGIQVVTDPAVVRRLERRFTEGRPPWPRRVGSQ